MTVLPGNESIGGQYRMREEIEAMFGWKHKDEDLKAEQTREAFQRRLLEVLQPIKRDWTTSEDSPSFPDGPANLRPALTARSEVRSLS